MTPIYRIAKFDETFTRAEGRKLKNLPWVSMPTNLNSNGYLSMLDEFEEGAASIYGCWCALVAIAATCTFRGVLATSRGGPLKPSRIARMSGFPVSELEKLFAWASMPEIGWLVEVPPEEMAKIMLIPRENDISGESPGDPPAHRGKSWDTEHNSNTTQHYRTEQNKAAASLDAAAAFQDLDVDEVRRSADKLYKCRPSLGKDFVWETCFLAQAVEPGIISDWTAKIQSGDVGKPKRYLQVALARECQSHGYDFEELRRAMPKSKEPAAV